MARLASTTFTLTLLVASSLASRAAAQVMNPANGHYYQAVPGNMDWSQARATAASMSFMGVAGHLATVSDTAENQWIYSTLAGMNLDRYWLGGFQDLNDPGFSEPLGGWVWVTGEPFSFDSWFGGGEPNNFGGAENFIAFDHGGGSWNDITDVWTLNAGFVVEFDVESFASSCSGDGGNQMGCTNCPCGNNATPGTVGGCINSAGTSTRLLPSGSASVAAADLRIEASGAPPSNSCVLTSGNALAPANMTNPCFGMDSGVQSVSLDGLRCAVQGVLRHGVRPSDANGDVGVTTNGWGPPNGFFNFGAFTAGQAKHFQIIHRDDAAAVCMTGQNTSQAVSVTFGA